MDLWFLLREGPERDIFRLLDHSRVKFDSGVHRLTFAARLLNAHDIAELPTMIRPVTTEDLREFFDSLARGFVRGG